LLGFKVWKAKSKNCQHHELLRQKVVVEENLSLTKRKLEDSEIDHQDVKDKLESVETDLEVLRMKLFGANPTKKDVEESLSR